MELLHRYRGALLGLAAGDALGTTLEFAPPGTFTPIDDMTGGGPFNLGPGQWTDDTAMALCLAESLIESRGFDARDQMQRYLLWYRKGHLSSNGSAFDIGNTVRAALIAFERDGDPMSGSEDPRTAGNGSLMRLAPVPLAYARRPERAIHLAAESSRTTHAAREAVDACRWFAGLLVGALLGLDKDSLLAPGFSPVPGLWEREPLAPRIAEIAAGSYLTRDPPEIRGTGYVADCLEAALWAFHRGTDFREGALLAVNLGEDADTTAAVYGQIAGAHYGVQGIPAPWREALARRETLRGYADLLLTLAEHLAAPGRP